MTRSPHHGDPTLTASRGARGAPQPASEPLRTAQRVGRFHVLRPIGAGGMGQVYEAYDPRLDRRVALKLLHDESDGESSPRLVREAQALAKLSHPNVVTVHDVGLHMGRLFVAMEFVEGTTLREWLTQHPPGSPERQLEALEMLLQAGEGLAAVHAAGLVHRDFKPGNVLVGKDGRARVADFGLVRVEGQTNGTDPDDTQTDHDAPEAEDGPPAPVVGGGGLVLDDRTLTRPGAILGTPAFMAPEQLQGETAGPAADQYAFCVSAWELMLGRRPFSGDSLFGVLEAIRDGEPARRSDVECPPRIEQALRQGLSFSPQERHASMQVLLVELRAALTQLRGEPAPRPRHGRRRAWGLALGAAVLATGLTLVLTQDRAEPCTGAERALAGVWDDDVRTRLEIAFLGSQLEFADNAWRTFEREVDGYADEWIAGHRDACEAAQVRREQSDALMDLRMACLDDRRRDLSALVEVYGAPDRTALALSYEAVAGLRPIDACADVGYVTQRGEIPQAGEAGERARAVLDAVSRAKALAEVGDLPEAKAVADRAVADAESMDVDALTAQALLRRGTVLMALHDERAAREDLERAHLLARSSPEVAFESSIALVHVEGVALERHDAGRTWERIARSEAESLDDPRKTAAMLLTVGRLRRAEGHLAQAQQSVEQAHALLVQHTESTDIRRTHALAELARILEIRGEPERATEMLREALAEAEATLGPNHPSLAQFHSGLAHALLYGGKLEQALGHAERGVALAEARFGPNHVALLGRLMTLAIVLDAMSEEDRAIAALRRAQSLDLPRPLEPGALSTTFAREGEILVEQGDATGAEIAFRRALALASPSLGDAHPRTVAYRIQLGATLGLLGRGNEARWLIESGIAVAEATLGVEHPDIAVSYDRVASFWEREGDMARAVEYSEKALRTYEAAFGVDNHQVVVGLANLCAELGHLDRTEAAIEHCHRALELVASGAEIPPSDVAIVENNLAAALTRSGQWTEAAEHYETARALWSDAIGPRSLQVGIALANLAECEAALGHQGEAQKLYEESLSIREEAVGPDDPIVVVPLVALAHLAAERGASGEAAELATRALTVAESRGSVMQTANAREALARALFRAGRRSRAAALVQLAEQVYSQAGPAGAQDMLRLQSWYPGEPEATSRGPSPSPPSP